MRRAAPLLVIVLLSACSSGGGETNTTASSSSGLPGSSASSGVACKLLTESDAQALFGVAPGKPETATVGGPESACLWKADIGDEHAIMQVAVFNGREHYDRTEKSGSQPLSGFGALASIDSGCSQGAVPKTCAGPVTLEFVRGGKTYFVLYSVANAKTPTHNAAYDRVEDLLSRLKQNVSKL